MTDELPDELPDDQLLENCLLTTRAERAVSNSHHVMDLPIKTVGDLRKISDEAILRIPDCGKTTLLEFRLLTGQIKPGQRKRIPSDKILKADWLRAVKHGQCECSFEQWKQERQS